MLSRLGVVLVSSALLFGGATHGGFASDVLVQFVAVACLGLAIASGVALHWPAFGVTTAVASALLMIQFVPLYGALTEHLSTSLPIEALPAWHIPTVTPHATLAAFVSTLPALVIVLLVGRMSTTARWHVVGAVLVIGAVSLVIGFVQVAQGPRSALRAFEFTNPFEAVGFFANRNHFAALMVATMVLAGAWLVALVARGAGRNGTSIDTLWIMAAGGLLLTTIVGLALARSRAGIVLAVPALIGVVLLGLKESGLRRAVPAKDLAGNRLVVGSIVTGVALAVVLGLGGLQARFAQDPLDDSRVQFARVTLTAIQAALPFGTGLASFAPVFAVAEPLDSLAPTFANRAHNDWLEFVLETGVAGAAVAVVFLGWYLTASVRAWTSRADGGETLARASSIVILVLLLHSVVDYPLRTTALQAVFAMCCACLLPLPQRTRRSVRPTGQATSEAPMSARRPAPVLWGGTTEWPAAWRRSSGPPSVTDQINRSTDT